MNNSEAYLDLIESGQILLVLLIGCVALAALVFVFLWGLADRSATAENS